MENRCDMAIIGGGAAGLAAAVFALREAKRPLTVQIFERGKRVGRKLAATGNGTCNITNETACESRYHGADPAFVTPLLTAFSPADAVAFFASLGVVCVTKEEGRVYPLCEQAGAVLDSLRLAAAALGAVERCETEVTALKPQKDGFLLVTAAGTVHARRVLICAGGAASPSLGGGNGGYSLLTALGHTRTPLFPSIVQVRTATDYVRAVKGIRVQAALTFLKNGSPLAAETGEVLFTEYGLSGPAVMQISRCVADWERQKRGAMEAQLDLLPAWSPQRLHAHLKERKALPGRTLEDYFTGLLNKRVGQTVLRATGITPLSRPASSLTEQELARLVTAVKAWRIPVTGTQGFGGAQVTAGGIATAEFSGKTLESRLVPGLYAAGEVLDIDGDCGGYNLQFAWSSAYTAARAMVRSLEGGAKT